MVTGRLRHLAELAGYYRKYLKEVPTSDSVIIQILGISSTLLNLLGVSILIPFFGLLFGNFTEGGSSKLLSAISHVPNLKNEIAVPAIGALIIISFFLKGAISVCFLGRTSNSTERHSAKLREKINFTYLNSIGHTLDIANRSKIIQLNSQLLQFTSFNYGLIDLNLKLYVFFSLLVFLFFLSAKITILASVFVLAIALIAAPIYGWTRRTSERYFSSLAKMQSHLTALLEGAEAVKSLNLVDQQQNKLANENASLIREAYKLSISRQTIFSMPEVLFISCAVMGALLFKPNPSELVYIGTYFYTLLKLVSALSEVNNRLSLLLELQQAPKDIYLYVGSYKEKISKGFLQIHKPIESIKFERVTVRAKQKNLISDVSFDLPVGKKIQIVGPNGSGKSTAFKCLNRLLPFDGAIFVNDINLLEIDEISLHKRIAYHGQNQFLFNDTLEQNLLAGNSGAPHEVLASITEEIGLGALIARLKDGLATVISEGSTNLSGGEKQLICLARTLLRNADVYIFDEYANHLDENTLGKVNNYLSGLDGKTVVLITHDPVAFADSTLKFYSGAIIS
jgi:ATP-binding cassette subfamily B protein IrtB